jgi:HK97 family phage major capsid protein
MQPNSHPASEERMRRHEEASARFRRGRFAYVDRTSGAEQRSVVSSTMGGLIPPTYLLDLYAKASRAGRVYADQCNRGNLPEDGMNLIIPRITTPTAAGSQTAELATLTTQDPVETDLTVPVRTIGSYLPVSRQSLERGSYSDLVLFEDMAARYHAQLGQQCINGSGGSGQFLGALNTSNIISVTKNTATLPEIFKSSVDAIVQMNTALGGLGYRASKCFMHPRRWAWLMAQTDTLGRPFLAHNHETASNSVG